jgi:hypothetical protein
MIEDKSKIREGLALLAILNYENVKGFRRMYGKGKENLSIDEIIESLDYMALRSLRNLINRSIEYKYGKVDK